MFSRPPIATKITVLALCISVATGCSEMDKKKVAAVVGTTVGAGVGATLGSTVGEGTGKKVATAIGAVLGGVIGSRIVKYLDERDKPIASAATNKALDSGTSQTWRNSETGTSGVIRVLTQSAGIPASTNRPASGRSSSAASTGSRYGLIEIVQRSIDNPQPTAKATTMRTTATAPDGRRPSTQATPRTATTAPPPQSPSTTSVAPTEQIAATTATTQASGRTCRTIQQEITLKDGSTHTEDVTACKGPNGWETA